MQNTNLKEFVGEFVKERSDMDAKYHGNYTAKRQRWQDEVIKSSMHVVPQTDPWIVFTCGPMGAGKGYAIEWMAKQGYVAVSPNARDYLPINVSICAYQYAGLKACPFI